MPDTAALASRPPRTEFLPFAPPLIGAEEKAELLDTLDSGWITKGPKTERFEQEFAAYVGAKHAVGLHSCTAALHLALIALGIGEGDEVITTTFTFASTGHAIQYVGATPVFLDCDRRTFNIAVDEIQSRITGRTRAIIPVHYGGQACLMDEIRAIAKARNLYVIEDAAHAAGSEYKGRKVGTLSDVTCFSFYATKNMTTGEGGMATSDDPEVIERIKVLSMYGISDARRIWQRYAPKGSWWYDIVELGYKYNMMDLQAALGIPQLCKLDGFNERRRHFAEMYNTAFADLPEIEVPEMLPYVKHAWHLYPILIRPERLTIDRNAFIEELRSENIGTSVLWIPLHMHSYYRNRFGYRPGDFPNALHIYERIINLPISPRMNDNDVLDVIGAIRRIIDRHRR
ncbi:MAG: UDP-4-amino-4,6-dideoxy-N-acetyl-beta-L-altrosamine transaminase [Acidobacteria bacterium RIFCSPLOWO2_02_FULL_67_36]|nr:MAG: UDP-4-amino-4,6-dideoxy-N-acetyl-beta-L-altrosamine transaminase [Acidobacteria bacterium RIFCSPLOWO2_02_FULL_67_36]OFW23095.1 MAG: UDP-4-amino-4,6-dideoxy-N-acetyl-beta-L-altrosamine transaminase [Acidobacteria bacterium RIFCSPLOWO2_12_FULL_66_21]